MAGEALPEAKIRLVIETEDSRKELEKVEASAERTEIEKDRVAKREERDRKTGETKAKRGVRIGVGGMKGKAMKLLATLGLVYGVAEFTEMILPSLTKWLVGVLPDEILKMPKIGPAIAKLPETTEMVSDLISDVKSHLGTSMGAAKGAAEAARAIGVLGMLPGAKVDSDEMIEFAKQLYTVMQVQNRAQRQQTKLSKEVFVETFGRLFTGGGQ
jgi:hypothetical protein